MADHHEDSTGAGGLAIGDLAARTGLAPGTIRMWEKRYGFPRPARTSAGYRRYSPRDAEILRRVIALREHGLSVTAALERAESDELGPRRPTIFGAMAADGRLPVRTLRKRTLVEISRAIEDETLARAGAAVVVGAFQRERFYRAVEHRYRRLAAVSDCVVALADFPAVRSPEGAPAEVPIDVSEAIGHEWAVIVDSPGLPVCLVGWEQPAGAPADDAERRFEAFWTLDPRTVRRAALAAAACVAITAPDVGKRLEETLETRPLAIEQPVPGLESLVARMLDYLDA